MYVIRRQRTRVRNGCVLAMIQYLHPSRLLSFVVQTRGLICDWWAAVNIHMHITIVLFYLFV